MKKTIGRRQHEDGDVQDHPYFHKAGNEDKDFHWESGRIHNIIRRSNFKGGLVCVNIR